MVPLIDRILEQIPYDIVTDTELTRLVTGSKASLYGQIKRSLAKGQLIHLRRGLYFLAKRYQRRPINSFEVAQKLYCPSYVSFESALSYHGLIPEAVYTVTNASLKRAREFKTPIGIYAYMTIPKNIFYVGVNRIEEQGSVFLMATPLKALADYVHYHRSDWKDLRSFLESLRIETGELRPGPSEVQELAAGYESKNVIRLLNEIKEGALL